MEKYKLWTTEGAEILFSLTSNTTARGQLVALTGDGFKAVREDEHFTKSKQLCTPGHRWARQNSERDWTNYVATENKVTNNYANLSREIKRYASGLKPVCSY